jgi:hypothetical protein
MGVDLRSGTHLSALALETTNALLSPLSSHLRTVGWLVHGPREDSRSFGRATYDFEDEIEIVKER